MVSSIVLSLVLDILFRLSLVESDTGIKEEIVKESKTEATECWRDVVLEIMVDPSWGFPSTSCITFENSSNESSVLRSVMAADTRIRSISVEDTEPEDRFGMD